MGGILDRLRTEVGMAPAAIPAIPATLQRADESRIAESQESHGPGDIEADLEWRIREMAKRWEYSADDMVEAMESARRDPAAMTKCCDHDEVRTLCDEPSLTGEK